MSMTEVVSGNGEVGASAPSNEDLGDLTENMIRLRILHTLWLYPKLSPSMLQVGIGTGFPPALWHPVLEKLVADGYVIRSQIQATNPVSKRDQTYTVLTAAAAAALSSE